MQGWSESGSGAFARRACGPHVEDDETSPAALRLAPAARTSALWRGDCSFAPRRQLASCAFSICAHEDPGVDGCPAGTIECPAGGPALQCIPPAQADGCCCELCI